LRHEFSRSCWAFKFTSKEERKDLDKQRTTWSGLFI
jgi:hypothetical protein